MAIVVGGGNFFRGSKWVGSSGLDRASADHIGCTFDTSYLLPARITAQNMLQYYSSLESLCLGSNRTIELVKGC